MFFKSSLLLAAVSAVCLGQGMPIPPPAGFNTVSIEQERAMGAQMFEGARQRATLSRDGAAQAYVDRVAARLIRSLPSASPFPIRFTVVEMLALQDQLGAPSDELVVYPGGNVFISLGLIRSTGEDELAGLMAHAMGHVVHRDQTRDQTMAQLVGMATVPLATIHTGGDHPLVTDGVRQAAAYAAPLAMAAIERKFETAADAFAVRLTASAGYNPEALENFIARQPDPVGALQLALSRYPRPSARANSMEKVLAKLRPLERRP